MGHRWVYAHVDTHVNAHVDAHMSMHMYIHMSIHMFIHMSMNRYEMVNVVLTDGVIGGVPVGFYNNTNCQWETGERAAVWPGNTTDVPADYFSGEVCDNIRSLSYSCVAGVVVCAIPCSNLPCACRQTHPLRPADPFHRLVGPWLQYRRCCCPRCCAG